MSEFPPCVGCGYCCLKVRCVVSMAVYPDLEAEGRCPALVWDGKRYLCDLARNLQYYMAIHAGEGCCSSLNNWRQDVKYRG
jgi:hypothetical protein